MPQKAFLTSMKEFFGLHPGQTPMQFGREEIQKLSHEEKLEFHRMLVAATGWDVAEPQKPKET